MIDLAQRSEPYEIPLPYGLSVEREAADHRGHGRRPVSGARRAVEAIERQIRERTNAGLTLDGLPDLSADGERDGFYQGQLMRALALRPGTDPAQDRGERPPGHCPLRRATPHPAPVFEVARRSA